MASARIILICTLLAALAGCRSEAPPRQSLKDHTATVPAEKDQAHAHAHAHAQCWDRYREHLSGKHPETLEEKLSSDATCRLVICPTCPH